MAAGSALEVAGLRVVRSGREVLHGISLSVERGSVAGLFGPSGSGKTTLMRSIVGVQKVAGGRADVLGVPAGTAAVRSRIGYVTQAPSVYSDLTVSQNLRYFATIASQPDERIDELLSFVGLARHRDRRVESLSGGERSRVSLATALAGRPELLVLDEPTTGLDPVLREDLWRKFHQLAAGGTTLLVSSHQLDEANECDELVLLRDGAVLRQTTPQALRAETGESDLGQAFLAVIQRR